MTENHPERPPFQRHQKYYLILKAAILAAGLVLALRYLGAL